ncbi:hypothetical protein NBRC111893_1000 [Lentilactobacillus kosonis]|uniref:Uncharacterized protein n=1 Tax=Lentilactobacillus kosonis TaxID=2810561 RepID=A0A401FKE8_9LACO|nr:hypothetical protein NBRC111893_1000 [Lentilactobacillus kosonis]
MLKRSKRMLRAFYYAVIKLVELIIKPSGILDKLRQFQI